MENCTLSKKRPRSDELNADDIDGNPQLFISRSSLDEFNEFAAECWIHEMFKSSTSSKINKPSIIEELDEHRDVKHKESSNIGQTTLPQSTIAILPSSSNKRPNTLTKSVDDDSHEVAAMKLSQNLAVLLKKPTSRSNAIVIKSTIDALISISQAPSLSLHKLTSAADFSKIPDDIIPIICEEIIKHPQQTKMMVIFSIACLLPKAKALSTSASRTYVKGLETLYRYNHMIVLKHFLARLLYERKPLTSSNSSGPSTSSWKPSHIHLELVQRMIRQVMPTQHKELFMVTLCSSGSSHSSGVDMTIDHMADAIDGGANEMTLKWSAEIAKIITALFTTGVALKKETLTQMILSMRDCALQMPSSEALTLLSAPVMTALTHLIVTTQLEQLTTESARAMKTLLMTSSSMLSKSSLATLEARNI